jgi:HK97 gp10 family phage protein
MGEFTTVGLEEVAQKFLRMEEAATKAVPLMLEAGANVLVKAQQDEAAAMGIKETAGFIQSIKATQVKGDDTERYVEVYPQGKAKHGNDRKGDKSNVRYATIGFIAQYGTSKIPARPYMTAANEKAHQQTTDAMYEVWKGVNNG